jgi:O-antigen/teichoic acid export membrane protein
VNRKDILWGYSAQLLNIGIGLLILPLLVIQLSSEELGLWYVFMAMAGLAQLLEFGFQPTIARQVSYVYSGATEIKKTGLPAAGTGGLNTELLVNVIFASRKIYRVISVCAAILLLGGGALYIKSLSYSGDSLSIYISWWVFASASIINFYFGYYNGLLQGRGDITKVNKVIVISRLVLFVLAAFLLFCGLGLLAMAIATLLSSVLNRILISRSFYDCDNRFLKKMSPNDNLTNILWGSSWRLGLVQFGSFLILRGNLFIAATFLGLSTAASYGLTLQIAMLIAAIASQLTSLQLPKMNSMQAIGNRNELLKLYSSSVVAGAMLVLFGFLSLIVLGDWILMFFNSKTPLLPIDLLTIMGVVILLEVHHSTSATYLTTCNDVPFLRASLVSGLAVALFSFVLVKWGGLGVVGLIAGQGIVQALFNNWYWPMTAMRHLQTTFLEVLSVGSRAMCHLITKNN